MGLESGTYINSLVVTNPIGSTDTVSTLDNHVRLLKSTIKNTFPNVNNQVNFTPTEANYLASASPGTGSASKALILNAARDIGNINILDVATLKINGTAVTSTAAELNKLDGVTATTAELNKLDGVTATTAELNYVDTTAGTAKASKAVVLDGSKDTTGINELTATTINQGANNVLDVSDIGGIVQAYDAQLDDISALAVTNGNFIVGNGSHWVAESGATARASLTAAKSGANSDITSLSALTAIEAGTNYTYYAYILESSSSSSTYTVTYSPSFIVPRDGTYRLSFKLKCDGATAYARVFINDVAGDSETSSTSSAFVNRSDNVALSEGDFVEVRIKNSGGYNTFIKNIFIRGTKPVFG